MAKEGETMRGKREGREGNEETRIKLKKDGDKGSS